MSNCQYSVTFNSIQTIHCDSNFICNEAEEKIVFDNVELNFKQYDYIVDQELLNCETSDKSSYRATINQVITNKNKDINTASEVYSATFNKNVYSATIKCG
jgi:hypothetical protein